MKINKFPVNKYIKRIPRIIVILTVSFLILIFILICFLKIDMTINGTGKAMPANYALVKIKEMGILKEINVNEGSYINKGDIIGYIDDMSINTLLTQAAAEREEIILKIKAAEDEKKTFSDELIQEIGIAYDNLNIAKLNYIKALNGGSRSEEIEIIEKEVEQTKIKRDDLKEKSKKYKLLFNKNAVAEQEYKELELSYLLLERELEKLNNKLQLAKKKYSGEDIEELRLKNESAKKYYESAVSKKDYIKVKELEIQQLREVLKSIESESSLISARKKWTALLSPASGYVLTNDVHLLKESSFLPGETLLEIGDTETIIVKAKIEEQSLPDIKIGQRVHIFFNALPYLNYGIFYGSVIKISPVISQPEFSSFSQSQFSLESLGSPNAMDSLISFINVEIKLDCPYYKKNNKKIYLQKGATCDVNIIVKKTTVLDLLLNKTKNKFSRMRHFSLYF
ncbi:HlyD family efflux transporter periplasmic adaptor subunit [Candidatus Dependentiae bacterium]|nr:HlyD family efflux transporter periplasmic adaptor subunit [Candidatus Dependentiae bacterium]